MMKSKTIGQENQLVTMETLSRGTHRDGTYDSRVENLDVWASVIAGLEASHWPRPIP